jgi:hypothetical protein
MSKIAHLDLTIPVPLTFLHLTLAFILPKASQELAKMPISSS